MSLQRMFDGRTALECTHGSKQQNIVTLLKSLKLKRQLLSPSPKYGTLAREQRHHRPANSRQENATWDSRSAQSDWDQRSRDRRVGRGAETTPISRQTVRRRETH
jgi:hypothetical protein